MNGSSEQATAVSTDMCTAMLIAMPTAALATAEHPREQKHTLELQMENANLSSTTDESRVQPKSFEYDESRLARH